VGGLITDGKPLPLWTAAMPERVELGCQLLYEDYGQAAKKGCLQGTVPDQHLHAVAKQSPYQLHARTQAAPDPPGMQTAGSAGMTCHHHSTGCAEPQHAAAAQEIGLALLPKFAGPEVVSQLRDLQADLLDRVAQSVAGSNGFAAAAGTTLSNSKATAAAAAAAAGAAGAAHDSSATAAAAAADGAAGATHDSSATAAGDSSSDTQPAGHSSKGFSVVQKMPISATGRLGFTYITGSGRRYSFAAPPGCNLTILLSLAGSGNVRALGCDRPAYHSNGLQGLGMRCLPSEVDGFTVASQYGSAVFMPDSVQCFARNLMQRNQKPSKLCVDVLRQLLASKDLLPPAALVPPCARLAEMTQQSTEFHSYVPASLVEKYGGRSFNKDPYLIRFHQVHTVQAAFMHSTQRATGCCVHLQQQQQQQDLCSSCVSAVFVLPTQK
jgi:hypothetical protein